MAQAETHLFIIWSKARDKEIEIRADIASNFKIVSEVEVTWSKDSFSKNLTRFYGTSLPTGSYKEKQDGTDPFLAIVVKDENPTYGTAETSRGQEVVNKRTFDAKQRHRDWTGGGHRVHSTTSTQEVDHDLTLLFGKNSQDFLAEMKDLKIYSDNIVGHEGWDTIEQLFYVMNNTMSYVVLRNFEGLPKEYTVGEHGDIDIMVDNLDNAVFITKAESIFLEDYRIHKRVKIAGKEVRFDFRYRGDNYYDDDWQQHILATRTLERGFYRPDAETYFYSLLYHALIHKSAIADDYIERLIAMGSELGITLSEELFADSNRITDVLGKHMRSNGWYFIRPQDLSVHFNQALIDEYRGWRSRHVSRLKKAVTQSPLKTAKQVAKKLRS